MKLKRLKRLLNRLTAVCVIANTIILLWIIGSIIEVNAHNGIDDQQTENPYNAVILFADALNKCAE